eukprot:1190807-Prorocentrum_minimum.AAC.3
MDVLLDGFLDGFLDDDFLYGFLDIGELTVSESTTQGTHGASHCPQHSLLQKGELTVSESTTQGTHDASHCMSTKDSYVYTRIVCKVKECVAHVRCP